MALADLAYSSVVSSTGWTNPTNVATSDDSRATDGQAGEVLNIELANAPGDYNDTNSGNTVTLKVEARFINTGRSKQITLDLLDSSNVIITDSVAANISGSTGDLTTADATYTVGPFTLADNYAASAVNGWRLRATITEGGGMPGTPPTAVEIDRMWVSIDYDIASADITMVADPGSISVNDPTTTNLEHHQKVTAELGAISVASPVEANLEHHRVLTAEDAGIFVATRYPPVAYDLFTRQVDANWTALTAGGALPVWVTGGYAAHSVGKSFWNAGTFANDQFCTAVVQRMQRTVGNLVEASVSVRHSSASSLYYAGVLSTDNTYGITKKYRLVEIDASDQSETELAFGGTPAAFAQGDRFLIEAEGTQITLYTDESGSGLVSRITATDATVTSGRPGFGGYDEETGSDRMLYDMWWGGDLTAETALQISRGTLVPEAGSIAVGVREIWSEDDFTVSVDEDLHLRPLPIGPANAIWNVRQASGDTMTVVASTDTVVLDNPPHEGYGSILGQTYDGTSGVFAIEMDLERISTGTGYPGVQMWETEDISAFGSAYFRWSETNGHWILAAGAGSAINDAGGTPWPGGVVTLRMEREGTTFRGYVNGSLVLTLTTPTSPWNVDTQVGTAGFILAGYTTAVFEIHAFRCYPPNQALLEYDRVLPASPGSVAVATPVETLLTVAAGATTLTADAGAVTVTGQDAGLLLSRLLTADPDSILISGQDAGTLVARVLGAAAGSVAVTGQDAALALTILLAAEAGAIASTGQDASLLRNRRLDALVGAYAVSGTDTGLHRGLVIVVDPGAFSSSGQDAALLRNKLLAPEAGAVTLSGAVTGLLWDQVMGAEAGAVSVTGAAANFLFGIRLAAEAGAFTVTGQDTGLLEFLLLAAEAGSISSSGQDAALLRNKLLAPEAGAVSVTGQDAGLLRAVVLPATGGAYVLTGAAAGFLRGLLLGAESGAFTVTGQDANLTLAGITTLTADAGAVTVTGQDAALVRALLLGAGAGAITVSGQDVTLIRGVAMTAEGGAVTVTGQDAGLLLDLVLSLEAGAYSITGQDSGLLRGLLLSTASGGFNISGADAILTVESSTTLTAEAGGYTVTGQAANFLRAIALAVDPGSVIVTGQDAGLLRDSRLTVEVGAYSTAGQDAGLTRAVVITPEGTAYTVAGQDAVLLRSQLLAAGAGAYTVTGADATLSYFTGDILLARPFTATFVQPGRTAAVEGPARTAEITGPIRTAIFIDPARTAEFEDPGRTGTFEEEN